MRWIAIAATVDNQVIAAHDDIVILETISDYDFEAIVKVYGLSDDEYNQLKQGNLNFRVRFNNLRSTWLEAYNRDARIVELSVIYSARIKALINLKGRLEHGLNKHRNLLTDQNNVYERKAKEAIQILTNKESPFRTDGFVRDFAEESNIDVDSAAAQILLKHNGWYQHMRKIERLRIRHFTAIKQAKTEQDFQTAAANLDKDLFINMLL